MSGKPCHSEAGNGGESRGAGSARRGASGSFEGVSLSSSTYAPKNLEKKLVRCGAGSAGCCANAARGIATSRDMVPRAAIRRWRIVGGSSRQRVAPPTSLTTSVEIFGVLARLNAHRIFERRNENRAGTVAFGIGGLGDDGDGLVRPTVRDDDLELDPRAEIDRVFLPPVGFGVPSVGIGFPHLAHGQDRHADLREGGLVLHQLERLDDGLELLHRCSTSSDS